jgi:hypothetical protein
MFIESLLYNRFSNKEISLNDIAADIYRRFNVDISKQGLDERFSLASAEFAKQLLYKALAHFTASVKLEKSFENFTTVKIKDSTNFDLPENLLTSYPGARGGGSRAGAHIQYEFDLKSGKTVDFEMTPGNINDYTNAWNTLDSISKGDLIIRDLGYSSLRVLNEINSKEAYFLSRVKTDTNLYELKGDTYKLLDLKALEKKMKSNGILCYEKNVYIGYRRYMPVRLIVTIVPDNKIEARIKRQRGKSKKRGSKIMNKSLKNIGLNLFISNVTSEDLSLDDVYSLYKIRWQIELIFKAWKSIGQFNKLNPTKPERILTMLYIRLLQIVMNMHIINPLSNIIFNNLKKRLSIYKAFKLMKINEEVIGNNLNCVKMLHTCIEKLLITLSKKALIESKKGKQSSVDILNNFCSKTII